MNLYPRSNHANLTIFSIHTTYTLIFFKVKMIIIGKYRNQLTVSL